MVDKGHEMPDAELHALEQALPGDRQKPEREADRRVMIDDFPILRAGTPGRVLPEQPEFNTTCDDRCHHGSWDRVLLQVVERPRDPASLGGGDAAEAAKSREIGPSSDCTHRRVAGRCDGGTGPAQPGESRGVSGTEIRGMVNENGLPGFPAVPSGISPECVQTEATMRAVTSKAVAYDTNASLYQVAGAGATAVTLSGSNNIATRPRDHKSCSSRNLMERVTCGVREFRRVAVRCFRRVRSHIRLWCSPHCGIFSIGASVKSVESAA